MCRRRDCSTDKVSEQRTARGSRIWHRARTLGRLSPCTSASRASSWARINRTTRAPAPRDLRRSLCTTRVTAANSSLVFEAGASTAQRQALLRAPKAARPLAWTCQRSATRLPRRQGIAPCRTCLKTSQTARWRSEAEKSRSGLTSSCATATLAPMRAS